VLPAASDGRMRAAAAAAAAARPLKARLRWTAELHALFSAAVEAAGGLALASPNATLLQMRARVPAGMALPLTVQHLKSHLQKCRMEEKRRAAAAGGAPGLAAGDDAGGDDDETGERQRKRRAVTVPPLPGLPSGAHVAATAAAAQRLLQLSSAAAAFSHQAR
jgi:SHAQKYF class myb-like DNA-binding protein